MKHQVPEDISGSGGQDDISGPGGQEDISGSGGQEDISGSGGQDDISDPGDQEDISGCGDQDDISGPGLPEAFYTSVNLAIAVTLIFLIVVTRRNVPKVGLLLIVYI